MDAGGAGKSQQLVSSQRDIASGRPYIDRLTTAIDRPLDVTLLQSRYRDGNLRSEFATARRCLNFAGSGSRKGQFNTATGRRHRNSAVDANQAALHVPATRSPRDFAVDFQQADVAT